MVSLNKAFISGLISWGKRGIGGVTLDCHDISIACKIYFLDEHDFNENVCERNGEKRVSLG